MPEARAIARRIFLSLSLALIYVDMCGAPQLNWIYV